MINNKFPTHLEIMEELIQTGYVERNSQNLVRLTEKGMLEIKNFMQSNAKMVALLSLAVRAVEKSFEKEEKKDE